MIGDGSKGGDCDEVNQESEQNEVDGMKNVNCTAA